MNPYDVLNVRDNASDMDIKKAYLAYKKKFDLNNYSGDHEYAKKRLDEIEKAFQILSNAYLRSAFDNRYNSHVRSHVTQKDVYKEYYQNDPIGTHYHRDYDLAMKKYNANKPLFDFTREAIKTYDNNMFEDENIKDYSDFSSKKTTNAIIKLFIFIIAASFIASILTTITSMFEGFTDIVKNEFYTPDTTKYYDETNDYTYEQEFNEMLEPEDDYTSSSSSSYNQNNDLVLSDYFTDKELLDLYNTTYKDSFDSFYEFKNYLTDYINQNNY